MAELTVSEQFCVICKHADKEVRARTFCYECHSILCESCSVQHQKTEMTKDHILLEMFQYDPSYKSHNDRSRCISVSSDDEALASDFARNVAMKDDINDIPEAKSAAGSRSDSYSILKNTNIRQTKDLALGTKQKEIVPRKFEASQMKAKESLSFNVEGPDDETDASVRGILYADDTFIVVDNDNEMLKTFDRNGNYLSRKRLKSPIWGIANVGSSKFVTCGKEKKLNVWIVHKQGKVRADVSFCVDHSAQGVSYNGSYFCVIHRKSNSISILDDQGIQTKNITINKAFGSKFEFGHDVLMDSDTNNIYVPCRDENGILCLTIEGKALWFYSLSDLPYGIVEIQGTLCFSDSSSSCLRLITKDGKYVGKLLKEKDLIDEPRYLCYGHEGNLYVSFEPDSDRGEQIYVYDIE